MILNNINHTMPIYLDCTLMEIMWVAITSLLILIIVFSLLIKLLFGYFWPGYVLASLLFYFVTKFCLSKLQKLKYGKPHAYYQHLLQKQLLKLGVKNSPYLIRIGKWSVRRIDPCG